CEVTGRKKLIMTALRWVSLDQPAACRPVIHPSSKEH
ncbi:MAG: hypothetical protein JWR83_2725, partial [Aeromicrobium sp.]|nr:hypothetical protein [Aeromicrobium sp.]